MSAFCSRLMAQIIALVVGLVFGLAVIDASVSAAHAGPYEDAVSHFAADDFDETTDGINEVTASGSPLAAVVIQALHDGQLFFSAETKTVLYRNQTDRLIDAATGTPFTAAAPTDLAPVQINNRLRRVVEAALGALTLMAPDPAKRLEAAQAVFKSRDEAALPALDQAIAKETDPRVKTALLAARASIVLKRDDASDADKIDAIALIRGLGNQDALALLAAVPADSLACREKGRDPTP